MDMGLKERVILVTGSSSGIGRSTALAFGREGARVAITYSKNRHGAEETAAFVQKAGAKTLIVQLDLASDESIYTAYKTITDQWKGVHVLVNNAVSWGSAGGWGAFEDAKPEQWRAMLRASLEGTYLMTQLVVPFMKQEAWGRIIFISSSTVDNFNPGTASYVTTKAGMQGIAHALAVEVAADGILSNVVQPGLTPLESNAGTIPLSVVDQETAATPTRRLSTPEEVAAAIVFLGSAANGHINGDVIHVTGGR